MADHGHGATAVDVAGDELAVDQVLHGPPDLGDGERVQLALTRGSGVEDQGKGRCWRLDDAHTLGAGELLRPRGLEAVEVEVHLVLGDLDRGLIDVERGENQPLGGGTRTAGLLGRGTGNGGEAADTAGTAAANPRPAAPCTRRRREILARRDIGMRDMFLRHGWTSGGAASAPLVHLTGPRSSPPRGLPPPRELPRRHQRRTDVLELPRDRIEPELGKKRSGRHVARLVVGAHVARTFAGDRHVDIGLKLASFIGAEIRDGDPADVDGDLGVGLKAEALDRHVAPSVATGRVEKE